MAGGAMSMQAVYAALSDALQSAADDAIARTSRRPRTL